jgi:APA family basic amino acid/polyamine antiporter
MLGVGILLTPPVVAAAAPSLAAFAALWVAGAVVALCGAAAYAELGAALPAAGGDVVFQQEAFGPSVAFGSGALVFGMAFSGSIAALAVAVGQYQAQTLVAAAGLDWDLSGAGARAVAVSLILLLTALNAAGARAATRLQVAATAVPLIALAGLATWGLATHGAPAPPVAPPPWRVGALAQAFAAVYFAYSGWPAVVYLAGEVRAPGRTLPIGMLGGATVVSALYGLLCAAFLSVLGVEGLAEAGEAGTALALALLGEPGAVLLAGLVLVALVASINGTILGGARVAQGMAERGALPRALAATDATSGAPVRALWLQAAVACVLALSGSFGAILSATGLAMMAVGGVTVAGLYRLRRSQPDLPRPYRATGYPLTPAVYLVVSGLTVGVGLWQAVTTGEALLPLAGLGLWAALVGGHALIRRSTRQR